MGNIGDPALAEAMNRLWVKFLPQMERRVATLEAAAAGLANGSITSAQQEAASSDAHKLAGVLGTFGLNEGTELARVAEIAYKNEVATDPIAASRLAEIALRLRSMIANRK